MKFQEIIVLLPCYSLEDLGLDRSRAEAQELLASWSGLLHPVLLDRVKSLPTWHRADDPPRELAGRLVVVPPCCEKLVPDDWPGDVDPSQTCLIRNLRGRNEIVAAALAAVEGEPSEVDGDLAGDFLVLGFCQFLVELLTRQLRYMSNLDEVGFQRESLAAAEKAVQGDADAARERLRNAFDLLTEAREYFYPVETYLLDLTLVAPTTVGASLRAELGSKGLRTVMLSGRTLVEMARREPETLAALRQSLENGTVSVIGGEFEEIELPLLPPEVALAHLRRGLDAYQRQLGQEPAVFARRRFGLTPVLPQVLKKLGFTGAVHFTLDDGRFPTSNQSKVRWEGIDGTPIEALARLPLDAAGAETFLRLPERLGDTMDLDHAATAIFAHWPGNVSLWYDDVRRMAEFSPVLGRFVSVEDYFRDTEYVGQTVKYMPDQYRSPYLRQAVADGRRDPISRWQRHLRQRAAAEAAAGLRCLAELLGLPAGEGEAGASAEDLIAAVDATLDPGAQSPDGLDGRLQGGLTSAVERLAAVLPRKGAEERGCLLVNPLSFSRRVWMEADHLPHVPGPGGAIKLADRQGEHNLAVVEVPPMGFAWIGPSTAPRAEEGPKPKRTLWRKKRDKEEPPPMAEENVLRNEFFEIRIDPVLGSIRSVSDYRTRGSRLAQQIALRRAPPPRGEGDWTAGDPEQLYSVMAADEITVLEAGPVIGRIRSRGRLLDREGGRVAGFAQTTTVRRGSRVIELEIKLDPVVEPGPNPWTSYYAARFAWNDATADLFRSVGGTSVPTELAALEAPHFVDVRGETTRTTILSGGLPFHRSLDLRKLDTLLLVRGETARRFRLGVGIDLDGPMPAALEFLAPEVLRYETAAPPGAPSGWLFHVGAKSVVATNWEPKRSEGRVEGVRLRLLETEGRGVKTRLRAFRPVRSAAKLDFQGNELAKLAAEGDAVSVTLDAHEWAQLEIDFG